MQSLRDRSSQSSTSAKFFRVFGVYFAIFASAVSTSEGSTILTTKKVASKPVTFVFATKSAAAPCVLIPPQEAAFRIHLPHTVPAASLLTRSMIVSTPVVVTPVSAATSVSFALPRGCHQ
jgi:hypothetical protein